jgi:hypothetical protein
MFPAESSLLDALVGDSLESGMSAGIAAWVAHLAFWVLLLYGWAWDELGPRGVIVFLVLWMLGFYGLPVFPLGAAMFSSFVAVMDVALVLLIFKGDVRLS